MRRLTDYGFYDYTRLIERFLNYEITTHQFEQTYLDTYLNENVPISDELFDILDTLFYYVDSYTDVEEAIRENPDFNINESQLRVGAAESLARLNKILESNDPLSEKI